MTMQYRADIDGLRALAVLAVVGFHAFPDYLPGGFIGVDIFFVLSGYLISSILFSKLGSGHFSILHVYARRIRRIFPALILVMAVVYIFGWFALWAHEYKDLGKHLSAASIFLANLVYWKETGYFDAAAEYKPLIHLWSLGVEEQFYIVWPLFILFLARYGWSLLRQATGHTRGDLHVAEDLVQDALVRMVRKTKVCLTENELLNWVSAVLRSVAVDHARKTASQARRIAEMPVVAIEYADTQPDDWLETGIGRLSEDERHLIYLRYQHGLTVSEIAAKLGIGQEATESRLVRTRNRLRDILRDLDTP